MKYRLTIDRFEGDPKSVAVLLADEGSSIDLPKTLLALTQADQGSV